MGNRAYAVVLTWGVGWAIASVLLPLTVQMVEPSSAAIVMAAFVIGVPLLAAPMYITARSIGATYPAAEAAAWVVLLSASVMVFARTTMSFDSINVVTTESIRQRQQTAHWPYPPELVWGMRCAVGFCTLAGVGSMLLNADSPSVFGRLWRGIAFATCVAAAFGVAALSFALVAPFISRLFAQEIGGIALAALLAGSLAGSGILTARRLLGGH